MVRHLKGAEVVYTSCTHAKECQMLSTYLKKIPRLLLIIGICCVQILNAKDTPAGEIIDQPSIENYGLLPEYRSVAISPDGKHYALIQRQGNQDFFVIVKAKTLELVGGFNADKYKARGIYFASNEHVILLSSEHTRMMQVRGSWENSSASVYNLTTKKIKVLLSKTKGLYPAQSGLGNIVGFNQDSNELYMPALAGSLRGTPKNHLYRVNLKNGKGKVHAKGNASTIGWFVDESGKILAREDYDNRANKHRIYSKVSGKWQVIYSHDTDIPEVSLQAVSRDGRELLFLDGEGNNQAIFSMSLADGSIKGPLYDRAVTDVGYVVTDINRKFVAVKYSGFTPDYDFNNAEDNRTYMDLAAYFPSSSVRLEGSTVDNNNWLINVSGNQGAGDYKVFDRVNNQLYNLVSEYPGIDAIGELKAVNFKSRDGMKIPSIITLPTDTNLRKNLPLIALPHGGPAAYDSVRFDWLAQYLAAKGYAVLQPNFRGSTGFGFALRDSGDGEWGQKMQNDVSDGVAALVRAGYVDPQRVCIMGVSYGGYSALAGGAFSPELYRCVISIAGVSDIPRMLGVEKSRYGRNHWVVSYWEKIIGDSKSEKEKLKTISPTNFADNFQAPVLLIHGRDDTVVPIRQSQEMYKALKKANKEVDFVTLKGEDHWLSNSETRLALLKEVDQFLEQHNPAGVL